MTRDFHITVNGVSQIYLSSRQQAAWPRSWLQTWSASSHLPGICISQGPAHKINIPHLNSFSFYPIPAPSFMQGTRPRTPPPTSKCFSAQDFAEYKLPSRRLMTSVCPSELCFWYMSGPWNVVLFSKYL